MRRSPNGGRGQVTAIVILTMLAILGSGCRDDGNDAYDPANAGERNAGEATDGADVESTTDDGSDTGRATDAQSPGVTESPTSDAPTRTDAPTGTEQPTGTESSAGTQPPTGTRPPTGSGQPDTSDAPSTSTVAPSTTSTQPPPTTQPPIDAGTRAFCDAFVAAENTFTRGPAVDFATATLEEIDAAVDAYETMVDQSLTAAAAAAPAAIASDVGTVATFIRSSLASGEDLSSDPEYRATDERVDVVIGGSCGYGTIAVSAIDYAFENLPTSLPGGRTTFAFTNNGAELHEMVVFRINDGVTDTVDELLELSEDEVFAKVEFTGATFGAQGETDTETFELRPGRYVALCFVPVGTTDPAIIDEDVEPGPPHFTEGMQAEFTVS